MGEKRAYKPRKPGGGRKKLKPEYDAWKNLKEQMERAVALYDYEIPKMQRLNEQQFKGLELEWHRPEEPEKEKT